MSYQNEKIGMMDQAYFVSRGDILKWLNDLLQLNLTKIQQLGSGAVYCQVIDVVHPGKIAIGKVNWKAKNDYQFIGNYRILQDAFNKVGIKRYIQVERLAKAKYQDNLQFAQWLKRYYDLNCGDRGNNYLAQERRGGVNPSFGFAQKNVVPKMYNGSGVVIPKKQSPPKTKAQQPPQPAPKKHTPVTSHRPTTQSGNRAVRKPQRKQQARSPKHKQQNKGEIKQLSAEKQQLQSRMQILQEQLERFNEQNSQKEEQIYSMRERQKQMTKKLKQMQDKILMVEQILKTQQNSQLKVQMISQIVKVPVKIQTPVPEPTENNQQEQQF